jgi:hypothetical protein
LTNKVNKKITLWWSMAQVTILAPQTEIVVSGDELDVDLSKVTGPVTFEVDGVLGAAEEVAFNTVNSDNSALPMVGDTDPKKLTLANTTATTWYRGVIRFTKTVTVAAVGIKMQRPG